MLIAKLTLSPTRTRYAQVVRTGPVQFDARPGWVLMTEPIGAPIRKRDFFWVHPDDTRIEWVRDFSFLDHGAPKPGSTNRLQQVILSEYLLLTNQHL